jgi:hypothetical protein
MTKKTALTTIVLLACLFASLACNLSVPGTDVQSPQRTDLPGTTPGSASAASTVVAGAPATAAPTLKKETPLPTLTPTRKVPNPNPVGIRQGLASLNTYRFTIKVKTNGPTAADRSENTTLYEVNAPKNSSHIHTETLTSSADSPSSEVSVSDIYNVGNQSCTVSKSGSELKGTLTDVDPLQNDMTNTLTGLMDFNIYTENPVFVAEETVNGIVTNHFSFKVTKLGKDSGGVVGKNNGDYWVAKDGQYLVKYALTLDLTGTAPNRTAVPSKTPAPGKTATPNKTPAATQSSTQTMHAEFTVELSGVNQVVDIAIPATCQKK